MFLVLIGVPGAGKGTVAQLFAKKGWVHFSMGAALRDHVKQNGKYAREVKSLLEKGHLAPDKIAYSVLSDYFSKFKNKKVIFDGFPRNMEQAKGAEKVLHSLEKDFDAFVFIDVPKKEVLSRLSSRRQCGACGKIYGATTPPRKKGICDTDGEKLVSRSDDKPSVIRERFRVYETETAPLLDWASTHYLIFRVDGMGKPTTVFKRVERVLSHIKAS